VALVRLDEGPMVTAQLTDLGGVKVDIGMPVEMVTRRIRSYGDERGMLVIGISSGRWCKGNHSNDRVDAFQKWRAFHFIYDFPASAKIQFYVTV
jgi:hypothetical protein